MYKCLSDSCGDCQQHYWLWVCVSVWGGIWALVTMMFVDYTQPQMMCCPAHITMNASLSHYLYIMATTPRRGQASSRLINPLTAQPKEKWEARQRCSLLIHRLYLTPQPWIACRTHYMTFVISLYTWRHSLARTHSFWIFCTFHFDEIYTGVHSKMLWGGFYSLLNMISLTVSRCNYSYCNGRKCITTASPHKHKHTSKDLQINCTYFQ